jgi:hypothetical protein
LASNQNVSNAVTFDDRALSFALFGYKVLAPRPSCKDGELMAEYHQSHSGCVRDGYYTETLINKKHMWGVSA